MDHVVDGHTGYDLGNDVDRDSPCDPMCSDCDGNFRCHYDYPRHGWIHVTVLYSLHCVHSVLECVLCGLDRYVCAIPGPETLSMASSLRLVECVYVQLLDTFPDCSNP